MIETGKNIRHNMTVNFGYMPMEYFCKKKLKGDTEDNRARN